MSVKKKTGRKVSRNVRTTDMAMLYYKLFSYINFEYFPEENDEKSLKVKISLCTSTLIH